MPEKKSVIISGVGPTLALYSELVKHYEVLVYDQAAAQHIVAQTGGSIGCPVNGAEPAMHDWVRNQAALLTTNITNNTNGAFNIDGIEHVALSEPWLYD